MRTAWLPFLLLVAACATPVRDGPASRPALPPPGPLVPADNGFLVGGTGLEIGFGRAEEGAVRAAERLKGERPAERGRTGSCTYARWEDGLVMVFRGRSFSGWIAREGRAGDTCGLA